MAAAFRPLLKLLADDDPERIVGEACVALARTGVLVESAAARELLLGAGATTRADRLLRTRDFDTFDRTIAPGQHILVVRLLYRGAGFGVFRYLEGYRFDVHNDYTFTANPGHRTDITAEAVEKPGASLRWEDRPLIKYSSRSAEDRSAARKR